jgi:hypothetical protein
LVHATRSLAVRKFHDLDDVKATLRPVDLPACMARKGSGLSMTQLIEVGGQGA